jgi:hypothetical protein
MTKNTKAVWVSAFGVVVIVVLALVVSDLWKTRQLTVDCDDGSRRTIDMRDFVTRYWAYSAELEATVGDKRFSSKLDPRPLQQLPDSLQHAKEFSKLLVAGYNACAITKEKYQQYMAQFQAMDNLARQINQITANPDPGTAAKGTLRDLVSQYAKLSQELASP